MFQKNSPIFKAIRLIGTPDVKWMLLFASCKFLVLFWKMNQCISF